MSVVISYADNKDRLGFPIETEDEGEPESSVFTEHSEPPDENT